MPLLLHCQVLFGGFLAQFGWLFLGFGGIFFWAFVMNADLASFYRFRGALETAKGVVLETKDTGASEGGSKNRRGTPIYAHWYSFTAADGREYRGVSYALGTHLEEGQEVVVEYPQGNPSISRIPGMRRAVFGPWAIFVIIFPLVGLGFILGSLASRLQAKRLLAEGKLGLGTLKSKVATNVQVNKQTVYKLTFEFVAEDGRTFEAVAKTHQVAALQDEAQERLLYDPASPARAVVLDELPGSLQLDDAGNLQAGNAPFGWLVLFLPAVTIFGHGAYAYLKYFR